MFNELDSDSDCRAIILSGNGKMFCAGIDLSTLMEMGQAAGAESDVARKAKMYYSIIRQFQNYHMALEKVKIMLNRFRAAVPIFHPVFLVT